MLPPGPKGLSAAIRMASRLVFHRPQCATGVCRVQFLSDSLTVANGKPTVANVLQRLFSNSSNGRGSNHKVELPRMGSQCNASLPDGWGAQSLSRRNRAGRSYPSLFHAPKTRLSNNPSQTPPKNASRTSRKTFQSQDGSATKVSGELFPTPKKSSNEIPGKLFETSNVTMTKTSVRPFHTKTEDTTNEETSSKVEDSSSQVDQETKLVEFVKDFLDNQVGRRSVVPKMMPALRSAGFRPQKGEVPALLKKHPNIFEYNPANQYVQLKRRKASEGEEVEELTFEDRERHFIEFLLALLQERTSPPEGLFLGWVAELSKHPASGVNLSGLPRPTRMIGKHFDLFAIDGFGTAMVRVRLTEQGRLRKPLQLAREFRVYLRSDEAARYREGVWTGEVEKKAEMEEKAKALSDEEVAVVAFLMRVLHAQGPNGRVKFSQFGKQLQTQGLTVNRKSPKLSNIVMRSREVFDIYDWGTHLAAVSLTQEGWEAAEKLPRLDGLKSASTREGAEESEKGGVGTNRKEAGRAPD